MRKIAGRLRLDLAQYREKQSFALFASEVDEETKKQLRQGALMVEVLKQGKYSPLPVEDQVIILYAAANGQMDKLPLDQVAVFEKGLVRYVRQADPSLIPLLKEFPKEAEERLKKLASQYKETFDVAVETPR